MPQAKLADVSIHYQIDGDEKNPVLVMSNSLGTTLDMWAPQVEALSARFRLLRYDTRGHGQSQVTSGPYSIAQLGADVLGLLDHLGIKKAHYCGLSMGGITGMWLAFSHPERIERLVLANTAAYIGPPENWTTRVAKVQQDGMASIASAVVSRWLTPDYAEKHPEQVAYLEDMLKATPAEGYTANCIAVRDADFRESIKKITAPTLVITGAGDMPTPPADGRYLAESIPGAKYVELAGAHLSNQQEPQRFSNAVLEFLQA